MEAIDFPLLPTEIEIAVAARQGGPVTVPGRRGDHVVMSLEVYQGLLGISDDDEEFKKTVEELKISFAQVAAGETMSLEKVREMLAKRYGD
jgi:hypothetical protein